MSRRRAAIDGSAIQGCVIFNHALAKTPGEGTRPAGNRALRAARPHAASSENANDAALLRHLMETVNSLTIQNGYGRLRKQMGVAAAGGGRVEESAPP